MEEVDILSKDDAISEVKENGTSVEYFIFDEFEVHLNKIPPNSIQEWHKHKLIEEVIVVTNGELTISWKENNETQHKTLVKGNVVRVKKSIHTIQNDTDKFAEFNVFRMVPTGDNKRDIIKNDKTVIKE